MLPDFTDALINSKIQEGFNGHPPLGVNATHSTGCCPSSSGSQFQRAPTLGGECYWVLDENEAPLKVAFQRAPTLGGECYRYHPYPLARYTRKFQRAPTLGGECYHTSGATARPTIYMFQRAPTLGGECYFALQSSSQAYPSACFNGHPPLGVNATRCCGGSVQSAGQSFNGHPPLGVNATAVTIAAASVLARFQRAPTLGGECYL